MEVAPKSIDRVREPVVAGSFYPKEAAILREAVECFLEDAAAPIGSPPVAIIAPHAGYAYSGQIAADAYNSAAGGYYDVVVILGTNHTVHNLEGCGLYPGDGYETPLGIARIDAGLQAKLLASNAGFVPHAASHLREHSIEVQLPFMQVLFPEVPFLPIVVSQLTGMDAKRFGAALADVLQDRRPLLVASSDFSHYPDHETADRVDREFLAGIESAFNSEEAIDVDSIEKLCYIRSRTVSTRACGYAPIIVAMSAARSLGARMARVISYANSGDSLFGEQDRVVGYGAVGFFEQKVKDVSLPSIEQRTELSDADKTALLKMARKSIAWYLSTGMSPLPRGFSTAAQRKQGVFVTLHPKRGMLRGCVGRMTSDLPLPQLVGLLAVGSATEDPRFRPLTATELGDVVIEISVLTSMESISSYEQIRLGVDGVMLEKRGRKAVFLPQVAVEQGWSRERLMQKLCEKAGLSPDSWKEGAKLQRFQSIAFEEHNES